MDYSTCAGCDKPFDVEKRDEMVAALDKNGQIVRVYHSEKCVNRTEMLVSLKGTFEVEKGN